MTLNVQETEHAAMQAGAKVFPTAPRNLLSTIVTLTSKASTNKARIDAPQTLSAEVKELAVLTAGAWEIHNVLQTAASMKVPTLEVLIDVGLTAIVKVAELAAHLAGVKEILGVVHRSTPLAKSMKLRTKWDQTDALGTLSVLVKELAAVKVGAKESRDAEELFNTFKTHVFYFSV